LVGFGSNQSTVSNTQLKVEKYRKPKAPTFVNSQRLATRANWSNIEFYSHIFSEKFSELIKAV